MYNTFVLDIWDAILAPFWILLIILFAFIIRDFTITDTKLKKYFIHGLILKILGGVGVCLVYQLYYSGGDTVAYYKTAQYINKAFWENIYDAFYLIFRTVKTKEEELLFNHEIYYQYGKYMPYYLNGSAYNVSRLAGIVSIPAFNSFLTMSVFFAAISYIGVWQFFRVFVSYFPNLHKEFAIAILYIPSVFFWGSGLLKDTITFASLGMITYNLYSIFIKRKHIVMNTILFFYCANLIIGIKAYILMAYLPLSFFWLFPDSVSKLSHPRVRFLIKPLIYIIIVAALPLSLNVLGQYSSKFSVDNVLEFAQAHQSDLKQDVYYKDDGGSRFDIGYFDGSFFSFVQLFPQAIIATFFRPFIWEVKNPVMLLSAFEAIWFMYLFFSIVIKYGIKGFYKAIFTEPFIQFAFLYALLFGFFVGFTTPVFGSLVRYKIPALPFFVASLYSVQYLASKQKANEAKIDMPNLHVDSKTA